MISNLNKYVSLSFLVQVVTVAVNFIYSLIIVRLMGASGFGEYSLFSNSLAFSLLLLGFNLPSVLVFYITNKRINAGRLLFTSMVVTLLLSGVLALLLNGSESMGWAIHIFPGGQNKTKWIFFFVTLFFLMQTSQLLIAYLNAHRVFVSVSLFLVISNLALLAFWAMYLQEWIRIPASLFDLVWWVNIILNLGTVGYLAILAIRKTTGKFEWRFLRIAEVKMVAGFALIVYACNTIQFLIYKMDIWFIHYFRTNEETGVYALALSLSQLIWILPNAVSVVLLNYYEVHKKEESVTMAMRYGRFSLYATLLSAGILSIIYYFALPVVYGFEFGRVFYLSLLLFLGAVPFSVAITIANLNSGIGFVRINLYATCFSFLLGLGLDILLIPAWGIEGAIAVKVVVYLCGVLFHIIAGRLMYGLPWRQLFAWPPSRKKI